MAKRGISSLTYVAGPTKTDADEERQSQRPGIRLVASASINQEFLRRGAERRVQRGFRVIRPSRPIRDMKNTPLMTVVHGFPCCLTPHRSLAAP